MDKAERERIQKLNALRFSNLNKITLKEAVEAKQAMKAKLAKLNDRETDGMYTQEYKNSEIAKAKQDYKNTLAKLYADDIETKLVEMQSSTEELNSVLADPDAVRNTAEIIKATGTALDSETLRKLVAPFAHDQLGLKVLQAACKSAGLAYDGGISQMTYDAGSSYNKLREAAQAAFVRQTISINSFASQAAKVAGLEGFEFDANPDPDGFMEALLQGAGLEPAPESAPTN